MELIWLDDFLALAEHLSFSRAAEARNITQPAFSRRIRALEEWTGAGLFDRTTHRVSLTSAGEHFRKGAESLTRDLYQLQRETQEIAGRRMATLSFAATHALSFTFFPKWLRRHESIVSLGSLNLISDSMEACEQLMLKGAAQFLLCHTHKNMPNRFGDRRFRSIVVGEDRLVPLCAPSEAATPLWPLQGTKAVRYLGYSGQSGLGRILEFTGVIERQSAVLEPVFTSHLAATLQSMARAGDGVAWLPYTLAQEDLAEGRLVAAGNAEADIPVEIRLFRPVARQSPSAEAIWSRVAGQETS